MSIIEAYNLWKEENKSAKLGKSTFASLRPQHVLPASKLPKNVCVCRYHENFILLLEALHKHDSAYPAYHHSLPACTVCEESSDNCWFNKCENCQNGTLFKAKYPVPNDLQTDSDTCNSESDQDPSYKYIKWMQWEKIEGMDGKDRQEKVRKCGLPSEVYHSLPQFNLHHYIKGRQSEHYNQMKTELPKKTYTAMMQTDFAENFSTLWQDEIQSAHCTKTQVTIFTCVYWHNNDYKSAVVISDDLDHSKESIIVFVNHLISALVDAEIKLLNIWSGGPSSQFKNRFIEAATRWLSNKHGIQLIWNFFPTSHGKGPVDAIGGTVKRQVSSRIIQHRAIVKDANSFYQCALDASSVINIFMISAANIKEFVDSQLIDFIDNAPQLPGISNAHQLSVKYDRIEMKSYSTCLASINSIKSPDENKSKNHVQNKNASIVCGTFVVVNYDFSGLIIS